MAFSSNYIFKNVELLRLRLDQDIAKLLIFDYKVSPTKK
jgi:hypothetical protein